LAHFDEIQDFQRLPVNGCILSVSNDFATVSNELIFQHDIMVAGRSRFVLNFSIRYTSYRSIYRPSVQ